MILTDKNYNIEFTFKTEPDMNAPAMGVATLITHQQHILIGQRIRQSQTCWQLPGGFMQLGETPHQAISRETFIKTGLELRQIQLIALTNNIFSTSKHTISLIFSAKCKDPTKLVVTKDKKNLNWYWANWDDLPSPLFLPLQTLVDSGYHPFHPYKRDLLQNKDNNCFIF